MDNEERHESIYEIPEKEEAKEPAVVVAVHEADETVVRDKVRAVCRACAGMVCTYLVSDRCSDHSSACVSVLFPPERVQPYLILDVREEDEYDECHIMEGAPLSPPPPPPRSRRADVRAAVCPAASDAASSLRVTPPLAECAPRHTTARSFPASRISQDKVTSEMFRYVSIRRSLVRAASRLPTAVLTTNADPRALVVSRLMVCRKIRRVESSCCTARTRNCRRPRRR